MRTSRYIFLLFGTLLLTIIAASSTALPPTAPFAGHASATINTDLSDYVWPTDAGNIGTSTFGEYRRTHFHAGIDISTGNSTGYKVFAVRDGYVARIRVSPVGYGKMLYVRHADGYYSTYAHLSHFNAEIDARVLIEQLKQESYPVDITCKPLDFPVRKGEVIAYTGDTGVGTAHLHFEIRDELLEPINPLLCTEFSFPDNIPPTIKKVSITPLGDYSTVNGKESHQVFQVHPVRKNVYKIPETVTISGTLGFAINVFDMSNGSRFRHGVYSHKLYIDDSLLYTVQMDRVPGRNAHEIGLYYDASLLEHGLGRFEKLYAETSSSLLFYSPRTPHAGIVNTSAFSQGPHSFRIVSTDFNNNSSEVSGKLIFNHRTPFTLEQRGADLQIAFEDIRTVSKVLISTRRINSDVWALKTMTPEGYASGNTISIADARQRYDVVQVVAENTAGSRSLPQYLFFRKPAGPAGTIKVEHDILRDRVIVNVRATRPFTEPPRVVVYEGDSKRTIDLRCQAIDRYTGSFQPLETFAGTRRVVVEGEVNGIVASAIDEFNLYPIPAGKSGTLSIDGGKLLVRYDSTSVFTTLYMQVDKLEDREPEYSLLPENTVLRGELNVTLHVTRPRQGQGLFFSGIGGWELLDKVSDETQTTLSGTITRTLGSIGVRTDDVPPTISRLSISHTSSRKPVISFRFGDNFSGVEYKDLKMYIDNVAVIPEVDGEHHRATYTATQPLERGSHRLTIRIADKMGNSSKVDHQFSVR